MPCSTAADSLKWYMTFLTRPEVLQLSSANIKTMITPKLDHPLQFANGTVKRSTEDAVVFAQGMSTFGSPDTGHGVSPLWFRISVLCAALMFQKVFGAAIPLPSVLVTDSTSSSNIQLSWLGASCCSSVW